MKEPEIAPGNSQGRDLAMDRGLGERAGLARLARVWYSWRSAAKNMIWVWLKIKHEWLRRCWSMFPLTRVPFWYRFFEPQPFGDAARTLELQVCFCTRAHTCQEIVAANV